MGQLKLHRSYQAPLCDQFGFNQPLQQEPNGLNFHRTDWESGGEEASSLMESQGFTEETRTSSRLKAGQT